MNNSRRFSPYIFGALAGAATMYFFDPRLGHRRRAMALDQGRHLVRVSARWLSGAAHDVALRTRGLGYEIARGFRGAPLDAGILVARVRSALGHHLSDIRLLDVMAAGDEVTLSGPIPSQDVQKALQVALAVGGVRVVHNALFPEQNLRHTTG